MSADDFDLPKLAAHGMPLLEIENLHVEIDGKEILKAVDLAVNRGELHAIMGPNGSGRSTLAYALASNDGYEPTGGQMRFDGKNLLDMAPDKRGRCSVPRVPVSAGRCRVATMTFLRKALDARRKKRGESELSKVRDVAGKRAEVHTLAHTLLKRRNFSHDGRSENSSDGKRSLGGR
jgi:Fe-S cluster assembly ATP-binding protein